MKKQSALFVVAAAALPLLASPSTAAPMQAQAGARTADVQSIVEQVAKRCRYDRRGRLRCRHMRSYRRHYYEPYPYYDYGYYPRWYGYGFGGGYGFGHHHHHGFHGHGHHHHH